MATKKDNVIQKINPNLEWAKERAEEIRREVESQPYDQIKDRIVTLNGSHGPSDKVVATKEVIEAARRKALVDYVQLQELISQIEERDEAKLEGRGGKTLNHRQLSLLNKGS